jgi:hypothetical protein
LTVRKISRRYARKIWRYRKHGKERIGWDVNKSIEKLISGRLFLTIVCGVVFAYCAAKRMLTSEAIIGIITLVVNSYFNRSDRWREQQNGGVQK